MSTPCAVDINAAHPEVTKKDAEQILARIANMAKLRAESNGGNIPQAMKEVTAAFARQDALEIAQMKRVAALDVQAQQNIINFAERFEKPGEGLKAMMLGSNKSIKGARLSVDYQAKDINGKYFGRVVHEMEQAGVLRQFRRNELSREIYQEMGELREGGKPGSSKSPAAKTIAGILDKISLEMTARLNRAGAFIGDLPGYVVRQTHDMMAIREAGPTREESYRAWKTFTAPLLDKEKTFGGDEPEKFMHNVHEALYTGVHGVMGAEGVNTGGFGGKLSQKVSQERVLHFSNADAAWQYNDRFGIKDLKEQAITDIRNKSRNIALMENLGPTPEANLATATRRLLEQAREKPNAAELVDSVNQHEIGAAFRQLTGVNDIPSNPNLARVVGNIKTIAQLSKMGGVFLTKLFGDKAFLQAEMAFQGMSHMQVLGAQVTGLAKRSTEQMKTLRLMGVAMDGLMGNALSRYSTTGLVSKTVDKAQRLFFDINFLNYWTDAHKATAGELMAAHLGEHADLPHGELPPTLQKVLGLYDIGPKQWNVLRDTAWTTEKGQRYITPDKLDQVPDTAIDTLIKDRGAEPSPNGRLRERDRLDTQLRAYFADRIDYAVPTPGGAEKLIVNQDTKAGTPLGEAVRLLMLFKSFPLTIAHKIISRDVYGNGAMTAKQWLLNDHQGKFNLAMMAAMATTGGYLGMAIRDGLHGKSPRELVTDGKLNWDTVNEAAIRGGGLGLMGDLVAQDYERNYSSFLERAAGPVLGQLDPFAQMLTKAKHGENFTKEAAKLTVDNLPLINLFYVRPVLDYYVLWNMQEMLNPGTLKRLEDSAEKRHQHYFVTPSAN